MENNTNWFSNGTVSEEEARVMYRVTDRAGTSGTPSPEDELSATRILYEWRYIWPPYCMIFLLSVVGNSLVIATLAQNRRMRTVTNVYLLNLAISDLLLGVFCLPFTLVGQILRQFMFGAAMCKLIPYLQAVSVSVSVWTLVAISVERYCAICQPLKSRRWQTQCHAYKMIALVWLMSLLLEAPILYASTLQQMTTNKYKCREDWSSLQMERLFNIGVDVSLLVVPFTVMSFAYCLIVHKLWSGMKHEIQNNCNWQKHLNRSASCKSNQVTGNHMTNATSSEDPYCAQNGNNYWLSKQLLPEKNGDANMIEKNINEERKVCCVEHAELKRHVMRSTHTDKSIEAKRKVIRMLFVIILEFFVCWTPVHVINTVYLFYPKELYVYIGSKGITTLQLLAYCSACCNPITYCFMNRKFREAFVRLFRCRSSCFEKQKQSSRQVEGQRSSNDMTACIVRGSHTGRTELEILEGEDCV